MDQTSYFSRGSSFPGFRAENPQESKRATWQRLAPAGRPTPVRSSPVQFHQLTATGSSSPTLPTHADAATRSAPPPAGRSRLAAAVAPSRSHLRQLRSIERRNPWRPPRCSSGRRRWRIHPFRLPDARPRWQRRRRYGRLPRPHSLGYLMPPWPLLTDPSPGACSPRFLQKFRGDIHGFS